MQFSMLLSIFPSYRLLLSFLLLFSGSGLVYQAGAQLPGGYCTQRLNSEGSSDKWWLPVCANVPLDVSNQSIDTLVVGIHGIGGDAPQMFSEIKAALASIESRRNTTLIIAPQFHEESSVGPDVPDGVLFWRLFPFWGTTDQGLVGPVRSSISITPYAVFEQLLLRVVEGGAFPNIKEILIVGFSGGGQFVQRYIGVNKVISRFALQRSISTRFLVSSPSSYLYLDGERPAAGSSTVFGVPETSFIASCPQYNNYGTGLDGLSIVPYISDLKSGDIILQYRNAPVLYLVGELDNNPLDPSLDRSCFATIQGPNRLERAQAFFLHLFETQGSEVLLQQELQVVPKVGHNLSQMVRSQQAITFFQIRSVVVPPTPTPTPMPSEVAIVTPTPALLPTATPFFTGGAPASRRQLRSQVRALAGYVRKISRGQRPIADIAAVADALDAILKSPPAGKISRTERSAIKGALRRSRSMSSIAILDVKSQMRALSSIRWYLKQALS